VNPTACFCVHVRFIMFPIYGLVGEKNRVIPFSHA
jgi:hypothetical protein